MPIYLLTAKSQNFYRVEVDFVGPHAQTQIKVGFAGTTPKKLNRVVGTVSIDDAKRLYQEQESYLNDAAKAAIGAFNPIKTCQHNYAALVELKAETGEVQPFAKYSNSSGLAYSLALAQAWAAKPGLNLLKQLKESEVEKPNHSNLPIFATGSVPADGQVREIDGVIDKLTQVCEWVENPENNITEFLVLLPQQNLEEAYLNKLKSDNQYDLFIALQKRIKGLGGGDIHGISSLSEGLSKIYGDVFDGGGDSNRDMGFVGLNPITFERRWLFFGRKELIESLQKVAQEAIEQKSLLTVYGYSGSGKSSAVMSGLAPSLLFSSSFSQHWGLARLNEIENLEQLLLPLLTALSKHLFVDEAERQTHLSKWFTLGDNLEALTAKLINTLSDRSEQHATCLWVIDQSEELYTQSKLRESKTQAFLMFLQALAATQRLLITLVIRAEYRDTLPIKNQTFAHIENIDPTELQDILEELQQFHRFEFSSAELDAPQDSPRRKHLEKRIVDEANGKPLTMLSYLLKKMYLYAKDQKLGSHYFTHNMYEALGGIDGVMAAQAEEALTESLSKASERQKQQLTQAFFSAFIGIDDNQRPVAMSPQRQSLEEDYPMGLMEVVHAFMNRGLIVDSGHGLKPCLRLSHDTLLNIESSQPHWQALAEWFKDNQAFLTWRKRIDESFLYWRLNTQNQNDMELDDSLFLGKYDIQEAKMFIDQSKIKDQLLIKFISESERCYAKKLEKELELVIEAKHNYALALNERMIRSLKEGNVDYAKLYAAYCLSMAKPENQPIESSALLVVEGLICRAFFKAYSHNMIVSPDGKTIGAICEDGTLRIWALLSNSSTTIKAHSGFVCNIAFSPCSQKVASYSFDDSCVTLSDIGTGKFRQFKVPHDVRTGFVFSPSGQSIVFSLQRGAVVLLDVETGKVEELEGGIKGHSFRDVAFSPDGNYIAAAASVGNGQGSYDSFIYVWNVATKKVEILEADSFLSCVGFMQDNIIVYGTSMGCIRVWNLQTRQHYQINKRASHVRSIESFSNGLLFVSGDTTTTVTLLGYEEIRLIVEGLEPILKEREKLFSLDYSVKTSSPQRVVKVWDKLEKECWEFAIRSKDSISSVFSSSSRFLMSGACKDSMRLWDLELMFQMQNPTQLKIIADDMALQLGIKLDVVDFVKVEGFNLDTQYPSLPEWPKDNKCYWLKKAEQYGDIWEGCDNDCCDALIKLGQIEFDDGNYSKAKEWFMKAENVGVRSDDWRLKKLDKYLEEPEEGSKQ